MSIDISTLTIGSHVLLVDNEIVPGIAYLEKGVRYKVTGIDSFNNLISLGDKYEERYGIKHALSFNPDNLSPIPITEELLKELGFEKSEHTETPYFKHFQDFSFVVYPHDNKWAVYIVEAGAKKGDNPYFKFSYMNQLEAFIRLTCGVSLT